MNKKYGVLFFIILYIAATYVYYLTGNSFIDSIILSTVFLASTLISNIFLYDFLKLGDR